MTVTRSPCQECKERLVILRASVTELGAERDALAARVKELERQLHDALALLREAGPALAEGAKLLRGMVAERRG